METDGNKTSRKTSQFFNCIYCDYNTSKSSNYKLHTMTLKHQKSLKVSNLETFGNKTSQKLALQEFSCEKCHKEFKNRSGLWKHKQKCNSNDTVIITTNKDATDVKQLTNMVFEVVKQNQELSLQNQELTNKLFEICKNGTNNVQNINNTNSHNKTFNLQFFLNETCKDAMNIMDFVDSIKLQLSDLEKVGELGYVDGISNIIVKNLKELDVTERPVHCTDSKREILYIKDENKWEKENDNKNKMKKAIKRVANKNINLLQDFKAKYPDCIYSDSKKSDQYNKLIIEAFELNNSEKEEKVIKKIAKEVTIDKNHCL